MRTLILVLLLPGCGVIVGKYNYQPIRAEPIPYNELVLSGGFRHCFDIKGIAIHAEPKIDCPDRSEVEKAIKFFLWEQKVAPGTFDGRMIIFAGSQIACDVKCKNAYPERLDDKRYRNKSNREKCLAAKKAEKEGGPLVGHDGCVQGYLAVVKLSGRAGMRDSWEEWQYHELCHFLGDTCGTPDPAHELMKCYNIPPPAPAPVMRGF